MASNIYAVATNFPAGVHLDQIQEYMIAVWPGDLFPLITTANGRPDANGIVTTGAIDLETPRALAGTEDADALAAFLLFVPVIPATRGGVLTAQLSAAIINGTTVFVLDAARLGAGTGVLCCWDGRDRTWRRVRDDVVVATIP